MTNEEGKKSYSTLTQDASHLFQNKKWTEEGEATEYILKTSFFSGEEEEEEEEEERSEEEKKRLIWTRKASLCDASRSLSRPEYFKIDKSYLLFFSSRKKMRMATGVQ